MTNNQRKNQEQRDDGDACEHPAEYLRREQRIGKEPFITCELCGATVSGSAGDPMIASGQAPRKRRA